MLLAAAGCAPSTAGAHPAPGARCGSAPGPSAGSALPFGLIDVSAVPGTRQAWALAERPAGRFTAPKRGNYLLHFSGLSWTKVVTFRRDIELKGVSAVSATAAWVWGDHWPSYRPFLALVSEGAVRQMRPALLRDVSVSSIASGGTADSWLAGSRFRGRRFLGQVVARWDGTSWLRVPVPAGARAVWPEGTSGPSDAWAVVTRGFAVNPWLVHWDGVTWSRAYRPPASLALRGRVPMNMSAAASPGHAWVAYTEAGTNSGSDARNPPPRTFSAYFDSRRWRMVPVPAIADSGLAEVTMSGQDAWAVAAYQNIRGVLYSHLGNAWCVQRLSAGPDAACFPASISAGAPTYVIAVTSPSSGICRSGYAYIYDGHRWRSANSRAGLRPAN